MPVRIVAHRGASFDAPENTSAAFRLAWRQGADAIEGDFRLTADGQVVCVHDPCLRRFGSPLRVARCTLADLRRADAGAWKSPAFAGERVATLEEVLALVPPGRHLRLEVKAGRRTLAAVAGVLRASAVPPGRVRVMSFDAAVVRAAKRLLPDFAADRLLACPPGRPPPTADAVVAGLRACRADGLGVEADPAAVTPAFGHAVRDAGFALGAWTVNAVGLARTMTAAGCDAITTDRPGLLRAASL